MQNLIGPIVKNAEIFLKNIFIPFFHVVFEPKIIGKGKKFGPG